MKRMWGALGLVLALTVFMPRVAAAQKQDPKARRNGATLGQNYRIRSILRLAFRSVWEMMRPPVPILLGSIV